MSRFSLFSALRRDSQGAAAVEFALVAPMLLTLLFGVMMIGIHMQAYNAVRSAAFDTERYTVVEYQRENKMLPVQIQQVALAIANRPPYGLKASELEACVTLADGFTEMTGAAKYDLELSYKPIEISGIFGFEPPRISYTQPIIVPGAGVPHDCNGGADGSDGG
ncbi:MAG: pilus assembly protein [Novosphingobium sp.]|nr:pilus assembly protein [Novosphingobium sp.]